MLSVAEFKKGLLIIIQQFFKVSHGRFSSRLRFASRSTDWKTRENSESVKVETECLEGIKCWILYELPTVYVPKAHYLLLYCNVGSTTTHLQQTIIIHNKNIDDIPTVPIHSLSKELPDKKWVKEIESIVLRTEQAYI